MSDVDWLPEVPALRSMVGPRESLDSIDLAYREREYPLMILQARDWSVGDDRLLFERIRREHHRACVFVMPKDCSIEFIAPQTPHPFELARWADDGGRV